MPAEKRVCYYPVFTMAEAAELEEKARRYGTAVEDYLRHLAGLDKLPPKSQGPIGRPPLAPDERAKREAVREEVRRLRVFVKSSLKVRDQAGGRRFAPYHEAEVLAAQRLLEEYGATGASPVGRLKEYQMKALKELVPESPKKAR